MAAPKAGSELDNTGAGRADTELGVGRALADADRLGRGTRRFRARLRGDCARPGVGERDAERRRLRREAVGHGERVEPAACRERVDGDLRPLDKLLDEAGAAPGGLDGQLDRTGNPGCVVHDREPSLTLPVGRLHNAWWVDLEHLLGRANQLPTRLRHSGLRKPRPLAELRDGGRSRLGPERVGQAQAGRDAGRNGDGPVDPGRDQPLNGLRPRKALDPRLVLGREDCPSNRVAEPRRARIPVTGDHQAASLAGAAEEAQLRRTGA